MRQLATARLIAAIVRAFTRTARHPAQPFATWRRSVDRRLGRRRRAFEEVEVTALVGLANVIHEQPPVAAHEALRSAAFHLAPRLELGFADVKGERALLD